MPGSKPYNDVSKTMENILFGIKGENPDLEFSAFADYATVNFAFIHPYLKEVALQCIEVSKNFELSLETREKLNLLEFFLLTD